MSDFQGRVILVTGAASGIGAATVRNLLAGGAQVAAADTNVKGLAQLEGVSRAKQSLLTMACDITDSSQVRASVDATVATFGSLDGLVNAAGIVVIGRFLEFDDAAWERCFRVNVIGTYTTIRYAVPHLKESGRGRIVNLSSGGGKMPAPFTTPYGASKAAVISLTRSAAVALAPEVTVNCVCPGIIDTPMWDQIEEGLARIDAPIDFRSRAAQAPLGRPGTPDDVAAAVTYLLSDEAQFITGEDLNVSGGLVMF